MNILPPTTDWFTFANRTTTSRFTCKNFPTTIESSMIRTNTNILKYRFTKIALLGLQTKLRMEALQCNVSKSFWFKLKSVSQAKTLKKLIYCY